MRSRNLKSLFVLLTLVVTSRVVMFIVTRYTADDAFITYRYAENLAEGRGFTYNPGENIQGTSTPLFTLVLAGAAKLCGAESIPILSRCIGIGADALSLLLIFKITLALGEASQFLACSLFALFPRLVFIAALGMEAPLIVALMILSFVLVSDGRGVAACLILGLLFVLRVDTILWSCLMLATMVWKQRRIPPAGLLIAALLSGSWVFYAGTIFGSVVPHAVQAKNASWRHLFGAFDPGRVLAGYFPFHGMRDFPGVIQWSLILLLLLPVFAVIPMLYRRHDPLLIFPSFFLLYNIAFSTARVIMADWYYLPGYAAYVLTLGCSFEWLQGAMQGTRLSGRAAQLLRLTVIPILTAFLALGIYRWKKDPGDWFQNEHVRIGGWLQHNAPEGSTVMLEPIGYIGWASRLYIHDMVGLVSPRVLEYRERFHGSDRWFLKYVEDLRPTYIVLQSHEIPSNQLFLGYGDGIFRDGGERDWFFARYGEVDEPALCAGVSDHYFVIYRLRDDNRL